MRLNPIEKKISSSQKYEFFQTTYLHNVIYTRIPNAIIYSLAGKSTVM